MFDVNGDMVGYMLFHAFIGPAVADLREAFAIFNTLGVKRLIVDLRYNGGGLLDLAATFNDLLGGPARLDAVQFRLTYNPKYSGLDRDIFFEPETDAIDLEKTVAFETLNSDGTGGYFDGLAPDCPVDDDLSFALGDERETSLDAALTLIDTGMCPVALSTSSAARSTLRVSDASVRGTTSWRTEAQVF